MYSARNDTSVGFPHSEILGSKPVFRLSGAYRRLPRPSSPSAAKASTRCACSLDHITERSISLRRSLILNFRQHTNFLSVVSNYRTDTSHFYESDVPNAFYCGDSLNSKLLKSYMAGNTQPTLIFVAIARGIYNPTKISLSNRNGGAEEDRTPDLLRARQSLSQLSYGPN